MEGLSVGITGAEGFIGSHLVKALKNDPAFKVALFKGNLLKEEDVEKYFSDNPYLDCLVHLAGLFQGDFDALLDANVKTTYNILEIGSKHGLKKIIYSSTGAVYGEPINKKSKETDPLNPVTLYGLVKLYAEECIKYYSRANNINYTILRFPNVYGPGSNKGVIYNFLKSISTDDSIEVRGDGKQERNFLHVRDAVEAIISAVKSEKINTTLNIADETSYTLNQLVEQLHKINGDFKIIYKNSDETNTLKSLSLENGLAKTLLGWEPKISLEKGVKEMISI